MKQSEDLPEKIKISEMLVDQIDKDIRSLNKNSSSDIATISEVRKNTRHIIYNKEDNTIALYNRAITDLVEQIEEVAVDAQSQALKKSIFQKLYNNQNRAGHYLGKR